MKDGGTNSRPRRAPPGAAPAAMLTAEKRAAGTNRQSDRGAPRALSQPAAPRASTGGEGHIELAPWPHVPKTWIPPKLDQNSLELHRLVHAWRALRLVDALAAFDTGVIGRMVREGELYLHPTLLGPCVILGPQGRARAGQRPDNRPGTDAVMNAAYMAHAISLLAADEGWSYIGMEGRSVHLMDDADGQRWMIIGQARGHTARTLRRLIKPLRYRATIRDERILIVTPDRRRSQSIERKNPRVEVLHLRMLRHVQRRSLREAKQEKLTGPGWERRDQSGERPWKAG